MKISNVIDFDVTNVEDINYLYFSELIDYNMYKALQHVNTYEVTDYQKSYRVSSHRIRIHQLWSDFKLWYKRSNNRVTLHTLFNVLRLIKIKTYWVDTHDYTLRAVNAKYKQGFYNILDSIREQYQFKQNNAVVTA